MREEDELSRMLEKLSEEKAKEILLKLLQQAIYPAFGSVPKREIELGVFDALERVGFISPDKGTYGLMRKLRVTRQKARNLLFDSQMRSFDQQKIDKRIFEMLSSPILQHQDKKIFLEVDDPVLTDRIKEILHEGKCLSDGSFSPSIVSMNMDAFACLVVFFSNIGGRNLQEQLIQAGLLQSNTQKIGSAIGLIVSATTGIPVNEIFQSLVEMKDIGKKIIADARKEVVLKEP